MAMALGSIVKAIRYAKNNPNLGRLCGAGAVLIGAGLYVWESVESSKQGMEPPDPEGIIRGALVGCLAGLGAAVLTPHQYFAFQESGSGFAGERFRPYDNSNVGVTRER
jgi:hypothetical protein